MIVLGVVLVAAFVLWKRFFAPVQFASWYILTDSTVTGANVLASGQVS